MSPEQTANRLESIAQEVEAASFMAQAGELAVKSLQDEVEGRIIGVVLTEVVDRLMEVVIHMREAAKAAA